MWRHTSRRSEAQRALLAETSFRRAMENSMLIGLRALDLNGRITYVNPAFCRMTGWTEAELVGRKPPFPYWPPNDQQEMQKQIDLTLQGKSPATGYEMRVMRRDGSSFFVDIAPENYAKLNQVDYLFVLDYNGSSEALKKDKTFQGLDVVKDGRVRYLDTDTGNAMSMPNPVTIPWAVDKFEEKL